MPTWYHAAQLLIRKRFSAGTQFDFNYTFSKSEDWASVEFQTSIQAANGQLDYSTEVEANVPSVSFDGDSPIFDINGTVKNNSAATISHINARVIVYDQDGKLVGAGQAFADNVGPGATASARGYGIGQAPAGPIHFEVTALGVTY